MSRLQHTPGTRATRGTVVAHVLREFVLWVAAVVGVICLLVAAAAVLLHVTPLVFRSGSMTPVIPTGSVALARTVPLDQLGTLHKGEVVSIVRADGIRVTHRIYAISFRDGQAQLTLKGDANKTPDAPVLTTDVERVFWSMPNLGYFLEDLARAPVVFGGGAAVGMLVMWAFRRPATVGAKELGLVTHADDDTAGSGPGSGSAVAGEGRITPATDLAPRHAPVATRLADERTATGPRHAARHAAPRQEQPRRVRHPGRTATRYGSLLATGIVLVLGVEMLVGSDPAHAAPWVDTVRATATVTAATPVAPSTVTCTNNGDNTVTVAWTYSGATPAAFDLVSGGSVVTSTAGTVKSVRLGGSGVLNLGATYTIFIRTDLTSTWTATSASSVVVKTASLLGIASASCG